jgi:hypothetical protein
MWKYSVTTHSRQNNLTIRTRINYTQSNNLEEYFATLNEMKEKLESMLPGTFKAKYNVGISGLMIQSTVKTSGEAHRIAYQMENYIKSAIIQLK